MSRTLRASALFALLLIIPAVPAAAASPIIDASQDKGRNAYADTYTCSRVGDVETCEYVSASVSVGRSRYNGESFKGTTLCAGTGTDTYDYSDGSGSWTSRYGCLEDADMKTLAGRGVGVAHNPESNMKLASGIAAVPQWLATGIRAGLGTDGAASNNDLDMFEAMRVAALLHKLATSNPQTLPARQVLELATRRGAEALGLADRIGSLEPGKQADVITVSMDGARQTPMFDAVSHLVYVAHGDDVTTTIVNGKVLMRDRKILTLDEAKVLADARAAADAVWAAVKTN